MIEFWKYISRTAVRANPDKIFLFGDNLEKAGFGGQAAEMRGEPNAIGIPTKRKPSMTPDSFFTDDEYEANIKAIDEALDVIPQGKPLVVPVAGLGTGLADLRNKAPKTFAYLESRLKQLK